MLAESDFTEQSFLLCHDASAEHLIGHAYQSRVCRLRIAPRLCFTSASRSSVSSIFSATSRASSADKFGIISPRMLGLVVSVSIFTALSTSDNFGLVGAVLAAC